MAAGALAILLALALLWYNSWVDGKAAADSARVLQKLHTAEPLAASVPPTAEEDGEPDIAMPVAVVENHTYIGTLALPSLSLELPVMDRWDYASLEIAPCRYTGNYKEDNLVIAGHNYLSHFKHIEMLQVGDAVSFLSATGEVYEYEVTETTLLTGDDVAGMIAGDDGWDLTLFTCNYSGNDRVTVRCTRIA